MDVDLLPRLRDYTLGEIVSAALEMTAVIDRCEEGAVEADLLPEDAPVSQMTVDEANIEYVHFMISGHHTSSDTTTRLDVMRDAPTAEMVDDFKLTYDYDSLLGATEDLPFRFAGHIWPVASYRDTLQKSVHLQHTWQENGRSKRLPYHKIPNIALMSGGRHHITRLMLPALLGTEGAPRIPVPIQQDLYDECIYKAAELVQNDVAGHWPASHKAELTRIQGRNGQLSFGTQVVAARNMVEFGETLLQKVREKQWGQNAFYFHQFRGTRGETLHESTEANIGNNGEDDFIDDNEYENLNPAVLRAMDALRDYLGMLVPANIDPEEWWVDVGAELQYPGKVLWWRNDCFHLLLQYCLSLSTEEAQTLANSSRTQMDQACQMTEVGGFRCTPSETEGCFTRVAYVQAYCTEKSVTYLLDGRLVSKSLEANKVLVTPAIAEQYAVRIGEAFGAAAQRFDGYARFETRVRLDSASRYQGFFTTDHREWLRYVIAFDREDYWMYKQLRLRACNQVIQWWGDGESQIRVNPLAVGLVVACVWMINALNNRPADQSEALRELGRVLLPSRLGRGTENDGGEEVEVNIRVPENPYNLFFVAKIRCDAKKTPIPRLERSLHLSDSSLAILANNITMKDVLYSISPPVERQARHPARVSNKMTRTMRLDPAGEDDNHLVQVEALGHSLRTVAFDEGSDLEDEETVYRPFGSTGGLDAQISRCWRDFLLAILQKSPNPRGSDQPSYCLLSNAERIEQYANVYARTNLGHVWRCCAVKTATVTEWRAAFDQCWPAGNRGLSSSAQNWGQLTYLKDWATLKSSLSSEATAAAARQLWNLFRKLCWFPAATADRVWHTKAHKGFTTYPRGTTTAPRILLNPGDDESNRFVFPG